MSKRSTVVFTAAIFGAMVTSVHAWDHPGHMTTADIAYSEIEKTRTRSDR